MSRNDGFLEERESALGKRVSIRFHDGDGTFRDLLGTLRELELVEKKDGTRVRFNPEAIAFFRVVPQ